MQVSWVSGYSAAWYGERTGHDPGLITRYTVKAQGQPKEPNTHTHAQTSQKKKEKSFYRLLLWEPLTLNVKKLYDDKHT